MAFSKYLLFLTIFYYVFISVFSGSAHCFLWKQTEGPLCYYTLCLTRAQGFGEWLVSFSLEIKRHILSPLHKHVAIRGTYKLSVVVTMLCVLSQTKSTLLPTGSAVSMLRSLFQDTHVQVSLHCPFVALLIYISVKVLHCILLVCQKKVDALTSY